MIRFKIKTIIIISILLVPVLFACLFHPVSAKTIDDINNVFGIQLLYAGNTGNLNINEPISNVIEIKAWSFACSPGTAGCDPDKYEIRFPSVINNVYGLGMQASANQVQVNDFLDTSFGNGHVVSSDKLDPAEFENDIGRMRTPIFVIPEKSIIIAYLQPEIKKIRLTRNGAYGCPVGNTCIVMKKHEIYPEGSPAELVLIKGSSMAESYSKLYDYLKSKGFYFKKPNYKAFGVNWETFDEFGCAPTKSQILSGDQNNPGIVEKFEQAGIKLSTVTIGSGYWKSSNTEGCSGTANNDPVTDTLEVSDNFGGLSGLNNLFGDLTGRGIYPILGMRHNVRFGTTFDNIQKIKDIFASRGIGDPYMSNNDYFVSAENTRGRLLNMENGAVINTWIDIIRNYYGNFKGIKQDDMLFSDQKRLDGGLPNLRDNLASKVLKNYNDKYNGDFIVFGRNDWFSSGTDGQSTQGWIGHFTPPSFSGYSSKIYLDSSLTQIVSGYPHPRPLFVDSNRFGSARTGLTISDQYKKEFLRDNQLMTFFPIANYSRGFWHINNSQYQDGLIFYLKLRDRLNQYAYDQAINWYETGIPNLMQPLFIRYNNDSNANNLYKLADSLNQAPDEFMFGNALLVRPVFSDNDSVNVYLPEGNWRPFMKSGSSMSGNKFVNYNIETQSNINDYPVFLKEGEILIIGDSNDFNNLYAYVFLDAISKSNEYEYHLKNGTVAHLVAEKDAQGNIYLKNIENGKSVLSSNDQYGKGWKIAPVCDILPDCNGDATPPAAPSGLSVQ